jgi:hypothetical protein
MAHPFASAFSTSRRWDEAVTRRVGIRARAAGEPEIGHHNRGQQPRGELVPALRIGGRGHLESGERERIAIHVTSVRVVFDEHNRGSFAHGATSLSRARRRRAGRVLSWVEYGRANRGRSREYSRPRWS